MQQQKCSVFIFSPLLLCFTSIRALYEAILSPLAAWFGVWWSGARATLLSRRHQLLFGHVKAAVALFASVLCIALVLRRTELVQRNDKLIVSNTYIIVSLYFGSRANVLHAPLFIKSPPPAQLNASNRVKAST